MSEPKKRKARRIEELTEDEIHQQMRLLAAILDETILEIFGAQYPFAAVLLSNAQVLEGKNSAVVNGAFNIASNANQVRIPKENMGAIMIAAGKFMAQNPEHVPKDPRGGDKHGTVH